MVEAGRTGRKDKAGFYDYDEDGKRTALWSGVREQYDSGSTDQPFADLQERMLFAEAIETIKRPDEGAPTSAPDAPTRPIPAPAHPPRPRGGPPPPPPHPRATP